MNIKFAKEYNWFKCKFKLYFEDIHINRTLKDLLKNDRLWVSFQKWPYNFC